jgi:hypothetical protein
MSFEDAAVLSECLGRLRDAFSEEKSFALKAYQVCRKERTEMILQRGNLQQTLYHLDDGKEQEERDRKIKAIGAATWDAEMEEGEALVWRDPVLAPKLLGYNHLEDVSRNTQFQYFSDHNTVSLECC